MTDFVIKFSPPKLLVSVRSLGEALTALQGGCDWLDVKEPSAGSLGAASLSTLQEISTISGSFAGWSAALGELTELSDYQWTDAFQTLPNLNMVKIGLSHCGPHWRQRLAQFRRNQPQISLAMVYYADRLNAQSPSWDETIQAAQELGSPIVLIDTFLKNGQTLLDFISLEELMILRQQLSKLNLGFALAGSLQSEQIPRIAQAAHPDLVAVRGAACKSGRNSELCVSRVALLKRILNQADD